MFPAGKLCNYEGPISAQAIAAHGGVRQVAKRMGWRVVGKNPSPWYDLRSTQEVFDGFAGEEGLPKRSLPSLEMLKRIGRKDMIKGAEEWGGMEELAELLEYQVCRTLRTTAFLNLPLCTLTSLTCQKIDENTKFPVHTLL